MESPSVFVFDADDTLWANEWQYSSSCAEFFNYLYEQFGDLMPNLWAVTTRFKTIDKNLYGEWGVRRGRVAEAMLQTFREILAYFNKIKYERKSTSEAGKLLNRRRIRRIEDKIIAIGDKPFEFTKARWLPCAQKVLAELRQNGHQLALLTSYDRNVWPLKEAFLFDEWAPFGSSVSVIHVPKTQDDFIHVSDCLHRPKGTKFYAVGNGISDILPAIKISENWRGIYIPYGSTSPLFTENTHNDPYIPPPIDHPRVVILRHIGQIRCLNFERFSLPHSGEEDCEKCKPSP